MKYLETGEVPPSDLVCELDSKLFDTSSKPSKARRSVGELF
jgi:hypothetical protein